MQNQQFPSAIGDWSQETITTLEETNHPETTYLEYKAHLEYPDGEDTPKSEWRADLEREFTAFGNASGGFIVFGISDDQTAHGIEPPDHEISQSVTQLIHETTPVVTTDVKSIPAPHGETNRIMVIVKVHEATRKPVATRDAAYSVRINDHKEPMNREQLESLFIETDRRQQAVRQLEFELASFMETYLATFDDYTLMDAPPEYHLLDNEGLKEAFRETTHLYTDDRVSNIVQGILKKLRDIDSAERQYGRMYNDIVSTHFEDRTQLNKKKREQFSGDVERLHQLIKQLVEQTDLSVRT